MMASRRTFLDLAAAGAATAILTARNKQAAAAISPVKVIAFDGFPIFDPRPVFARVEQVFPEQGRELGSLWRSRQFEYTWIRTLTGQYADFWRVTEDALVFAAKMLKLDLTAEQRDYLMLAYLELKPWPDALTALKELKAQGLRLAFLSNFTPAMLDTAVGTAGLDGIFDAHLSTDKVRAFKPDPRAYRMALDAYGLERHEIAFCAFGGWDAAGAKAFGYPTIWINRMNAPVEELGIMPDAIGSGLSDLVKFVGS
jgi:2-haloacid dehalogenase